MRLRGLLRCGGGVGETGTALRSDSLWAESEQELKSLLMKVKEESEKVA